MAREGDELVNPVTGLRTIFRKTARETSGELLQVDWIGDPGWTTGPDHVHPRQEERFEVISGELGLRVEGVERFHGAGEVIVAPAGSAHAAWNASSDDDAHVLVDFRPALRTEIATRAAEGLLWACAEVPAEGGQLRDALLRLLALSRARTSDS